MYKTLREAIRRCAELSRSRRRRAKSSYIRLLACCYEEEIR
jgi:hypothetical protein